ncbi:MAG: MBL fold metallo-hydrolase [Gemmatimonadales bacterium]
MIRLVTVGTGTVAPHPLRSSPAHWVEAGPVRLLMDCGAGTCHTLATLGLPWDDVTHIALTHFHTDHYGELPAFLFALKYGTMTPRREPLTLLGPQGTRAKLDLLAGSFGPWVSAPGFPLEVVEVLPGTPVELVAGVRLAVHKTPHTDESIALSVETSDARLVYTGDTGPSEELGDWAKGADLLLAECSLPESMALPMHLTPRQAGALARRAEAKRLVLTHLYPPVEHVDILGEVATEYAGPAQVARDGDRFEIQGT